MQQGDFRPTEKERQSVMKIISPETKAMCEGKQLLDDRLIARQKAKDKAMESQVIQDP